MDNEEIKAKGNVFLNETIDLLNTFTTSIFEIDYNKIDVKEIKEGFELFIYQTRDESKKYLNKTYFYFSLISFINEAFLNHKENLSDFDRLSLKINLVLDDVLKTEQEIETSKAFLSLYEYPLKQIENLNLQESKEAKEFVNMQNKHIAEIKKKSESPLSLEKFLKTKENINVLEEFLERCIENYLEFISYDIAIETIKEKFNITNEFYFKKPLELASFKRTKETITKFIELIDSQKALINNETRYFLTTYTTLESIVNSEKINERKATILEEINTKEALKDSLSNEYNLEVFNPLESGVEININKIIKTFKKS